MTDRYISVRNWRRFQHYDPAKRAPAWIKNHASLLHDDDYLGLTQHRALLLHRLWLEYASSRARLKFDTSSLSRRLGLKVTSTDLEALNDAGFIEFVASATLADGYLAASLEVEVEVEKEVLDRTNDARARARANPTGRLATAVERARAWIRNGLAAEVPPERLVDVIADEFKIEDPDTLDELIAEAKSRPP